MADSDSNPTALGSFLYVPRGNQFQLVADSDYGVSFQPYSPGVFNQALLDSQGYRNADTPFQIHENIVDAYLKHDSTYGAFYYSPYRGFRSFGQGLIMAMDSDIQNPTLTTGDDGVVQVWVG